MLLSFLADHYSPHDTFALSTQRASRGSPEHISDYFAGVTNVSFHDTNDQYCEAMIRSFKDRRAQAVFEGRAPGKGFPPALIRPARRKLVMLDAARELRDLRAPPSNHLEALKGDRAGQYSIRINSQYRLCFRWTGQDAEDVEVTDYH